MWAGPRPPQHGIRSRDGATTPFGALDIATGKVIAECKAGHRYWEFIAFLRLIDKEVPADLDIHLVLDNCATHKYPEVKAWLAKCPNYHLHGTPTYFVVAEPSGVPARPAQRPGTEARCVSQRTRASGADPSLHGGSQRNRKAVHGGRHGPIHPRNSGVLIYTCFRYKTLDSDCNKTQVRPNLWPECQESLQAVLR